MSTSSSKTQITARTFARFRADDIKRMLTQESAQQADATIQDLQRARRFVPYVLALGPLNFHRDDLFGPDMLAEVLSGPDADECKRKLHHACEVAQSLLTTVDDTQSLKLLMDVIDTVPTELALLYAQAGYLLGVAVGQELGPHAFASEQGRS
jgi:hypothetical protein